MITVVIIYAICWLPLHTVTLVGDTHEEIWNFKYIQIVWISCHWLAMSNCCYNPMVYCWMNSTFRNGFRYILRFCPCIDLNNDRRQPTHPTCSSQSTYVTTIRNSCLPDKRGSNTGCVASYGRSPAKRQLYKETSIYNHQECQPLNKRIGALNSGTGRGLMTTRLVHSTHCAARDHGHSIPCQLEVMEGE